MTRRIMLTVAYDGTGYRGFQMQPGVPTIEGELNRHLCALLGEEIRVTGGSRTDTGVHALCNVAVFDTGSAIPAEKIAYALNSRLPEDIRIQGSREVPEKFHPRRRFSRKTYEYRITRGEFPLPTKRLYSCFTYYALDVDRMRQAAAYLEGEHDFRSFCSVKTAADSTVRTVYALDVEEQGADIVIRVCGNGFLYNMVRIIAGTLMEVGKGKLEPEQMPAILQACDRKAAGPTAPACGLTLVRYEWEENPDENMDFFAYKKVSES